jgi:hypothetical protein
LRETIEEVTMNAVCIHQPAASDIARGWRHVLSMDWETDFRGELVLCAGTQPPAPSPEEEIPLPRGMALARATLEDVHPLSTEDLRLVGLKEMPEKRHFAWVFKDIRELEPFSVQEREGIFSLDLASEDLVELDPTEYEDHLEFYNKVVVPELSLHLAEVHDEFSQKPLSPKRTIKEE